MCRAVGIGVLRTLYIVTPMQGVAYFGAVFGPTASVVTGILPSDVHLQWICHFLLLLAHVERGHWKDS